MRAKRYHLSRLARRKQYMSKSKGGRDHGRARWIVLPRSRGKSRSRPATSVFKLGLNRNQSYTSSRTCRYLISLKSRRPCDSAKIRSTHAISSTSSGRSFSCKAPTRSIAAARLTWTSSQGSISKPSCRTLQRYASETAVRARS